MIRRLLAAAALWLDDLRASHRMRRGQIGPMSKGSLFERCAKVNIANSMPKSGMD